MNVDNSVIDCQLQFEMVFIVVDKGGNVDKKGDDVDFLGQLICGYVSFLIEKNKWCFIG